MAELQPVEPPTTFESLDDALILHVLSFRLPDMHLLGRCRQVSSRWNTLAGDDMLWKVACKEQFGLAEPRAPPSETYTPPTFYHAAKKWSALRVSLGLSGQQPELAPMHMSAHSTWHRLRTWAQVHLPVAATSLGAPASTAGWNAFLTWIEADNHWVQGGTPPGLLQLRILSSIHDGQAFATDAQVASHHCQEALGEDDEGLVQALKDLSAAPLSGGDSLSERNHIQLEQHLGLLGGMSAYDTCLSVRLFPLAVCAAWTLFFRRSQDAALTSVIVGGSFNLQRILILDMITGELHAGPAQGVPHGRTGVPLTTTGRTPQMLRTVPLSTPAGGDLVAYLAEHARRIENGTYEVEPLVPLHSFTEGLSLFPQGGPKYSEAVTRGVRVTASSIYVAEVGMFVYSIRLKLLSPAEEGGLSASERGFETCQLKERKWLLAQRDGPPEVVQGLGVVGRFPLLREGGWREDRQTDASGRIATGKDNSGIFIYQSMSGRGPTCAFEGEITMVPGSIHRPTGEPFQVTVARFPLEAGADEFLF